MHLNEKKAVTFDQAAVLAEEFVLTLKQTLLWDNTQIMGEEACSLRCCLLSRHLLCLPPFPKQSFVSSSLERLCFSCKKPGHVVADYAVLNKKQKSIQPVAFVE